MEPTSYPDRNNEMNLRSLDALMVGSEVATLERAHADSRPVSLGTAGSERMACVARVRGHESMDSKDDSKKASFDAQALSHSWRLR